MATDPRTIIDSSQDPGLSPAPNNSASSNVADYDTRERKTVIIDYTDPPLYGVPELQIFNDPGGSNGQVQFNKGNRFGGDNNLVWNSKVRTLSILGNLRASGEITGRIVTNTTKLKITGGEAGDTLITDGTGNLSWVPAPEAAYGNANVANYLPTYTGNLSGSNLTISNTAYIYNISSTGLASLTTVNVSSNLTTNAIYTNNYFYANGNVVPIGIAGNSLVNGNNSFALDVDGNVVFQGISSGDAVNRGLVWDYGADANGVNSQVRQDGDGLTVRAYTESGGGANGYSAPVNIVTNQDANTKAWIFDGDGNLTLPGNTSSINYANGSPYGGGGNANLGYFSFSGNTMSVLSDGTIRAFTSAGYQPNITIELDSEELFPILYSFTSQGLLFPGGGIIDGSDFDVDIIAGNDVGNSTYGHISFTTDGPIGMNSLTFNSLGELTVSTAEANDGLIKWVGNSSGDGNGYTTMALVPDTTVEGNDQYLIIDPTAGEPGHIHIRAGGTQDNSNAVLILGGENSYFRVNSGLNPDVSISANTKNWNFGTDGTLALPEGGTISDVIPGTGAAASIDVIQVASSIPNEVFVSLPPATVTDYNVPGTNIIVNVTWVTNGPSYYTPRFEVVDGGTGHTGGGEFGGGDVLTVPYVDMGINLGQDWIWYVGTIASNLILEAGLNSWTLSGEGNLILPGNTFAVNYANGTQVSIGGNTGNVTFSGETVIGTGTSNTMSGLYLAPDPASLANSLYLRVRGNIQDEPTHIHFDTGNNQYYNQFIGDDLKYIQLANTGNIVVNSNDSVGNSAQWIFGTDGLLTLPSGNVAIGLQYGSEAILASNTNFGVATQGANVTTFINWSDDVANTSLISALYVNAPSANAGDIHIRTGGIGNANIWQFNVDGNLVLPGNTFSVNYANGTQVSIGGGGNTGNVTFDDNIVIGTSNLKLQPDSANSSAYLDIYLTGGPDIHIAGNGETVILGTDEFANVTVNVDGNVSIQANAGTPYTWNFGTDGTTTLPTNISIDYSGGNIEFPRIIADTGKAFSVQAQGNSGSAALAWTVDPDAASQYAAVAVTRGGGGNLAKAILTAQSNSGDVATSKIWQFDENGTTRFPGDIILAPASQSITMQSDQYSQLMWQNANANVAPNMATYSNFFVAQNSAVLDIGYLDGNSNPQFKEWLWGVDGTMTLPTAGRINFDNLSISSDANVSAFYAPSGNVQLAAGTGNAQIVANSLNDSKTWTFGTDGILTLPQGSQISETANTSVNITANANTWAFGVDGNLTVPGSLINDTSIVLSAPAVFNICTIATAGSGYDTGSSLKATTGGSGTGMTVGIGYGLSNQLTSVGVVNPGTGYVNGDVITVSEGTGGTFVISKYNESANQTNNNTVQTNLTFANNTLTLPTYGEIIAPGNITANNIGNITSINLDGNVSNVLTGNGTYVAIPTVPTVGNIATINLDGNVSNVLTGNGTFAAVPAPTVSQDITSNGAMSIMTYDGTIKYVNYATVEPSSGNIAGGNISANGNISGNNISVSGNLTVNNTLVNRVYLLEAYANVTYTLPGSFTEDTCRYSIVSSNVNVSSAWFNTSTYTFTPR